MPAYIKVTLTCDAPTCLASIDVRCELAAFPNGSREDSRMVVDVRPPAGWWQGTVSGYGEPEPRCACPEHVTKLRGW